MIDHNKKILDRTSQGGTFQMKRYLMWPLVVTAAVVLSSVLPGYDQHAAKQELGGGIHPGMPVQDVAPVPDYVSPGDTHKVQVRADDTVGLEMAKGGRLVADYGSYKLIEVDSATAGKLGRERRAELRDEYNLILLNTGAIDTTTRAAAALRAQSSISNGARKKLHLVQFAGPIKPKWYESLVETGVQVVSYIPNNAYLVYGDARSLRRVKRLSRTMSAMQWEGAYLDNYRIDPGVYSKEKDRAVTAGKIEPGDVYAIQLVADPAANEKTLSLINDYKTEDIKNQWEILNYVDIVVGLPTSAIKDISTQPDVVSIQPYVTPQLRDERQDQIMAGNLAGNLPSAADYLAYLAGKGFTQSQFNTSAFAVDVSDDGLENGLTAVDNPNLHEGGDAANPSRVVYNRIESSGGATTPGRTGFEGHGNLNTHVIGGFVNFAFNSGFPHADSSGFRYGLGICPFVKVGQSAIFNPSFTNPNFANLQSRAYNDGARISSNSWGANTAGSYTVDSQSYDALVRDAQPAGAAVPAAGNQEMVIVFAAGNAGSGAQTVGSPGTAKNVICVGAAENVHSHSTANGGSTASGADGCGITDTGADSANDMISFSSRGPCADGRKKPDIVGPGTHVTGGVAQAPMPPANGGALATFNANSVCALSGSGGTGNPNNFFPLGQQWYTTSSGTSHSTPAVAGECALLRQDAINRVLTPYSPAMTKALLMNSARYMTGAGANDTLWSNVQGMGEVDLNNYFDIFSTTNILRDELGADVFTATGQQRVFTGNVVDNGKPFKVTLAWTDAPGPTSGNAFINNLDLEVTVGGNTYKGNVFSGANSATGGTADTRDNVESVFVPAGVSGAFLVRVIATNIAGDGVPNVGGALDQDFALVVTNSIEVAQPVIASAGATLTAESCTPTNGALDPDENVTVSLCLQNVGTQDTVDLVGTLQATGGVVSPSASQSYGALVGGGASVCRNFTFTVSAACGDVVTATLDLSDGMTSLGSVTYNLQTGVLTVAFSENFDGVTAPALPAGWTTSFVNGAANCTPTGTCALGTNWTTATTNAPPSAPNAAFHNDATCVTDAFLVTPSINITTSTAQLTFRQARNLENNFDGSVLEVSTDGGGSWNDVTSGAIGGSFVTGGYNGTISNNFLSPIKGRPAWTGLSGGSTAAPAYITSVVNLGPMVSGKTINLRWRVASDCSLAASGLSGQWIDDITLTDGFTCSTNCGTCTEPPQITCPDSVTVVGTPGAACVVVNYPAPIATDDCPGLVVVCTPPSGFCFPVGATTVTCTATDSSANVATCTFTVTVFDICLQDDSSASTVMLINSSTGDYRFCCHGTVYTGQGTITKKGNTIALQQNGPDRRVVAKVDTASKKASASLQFPPGKTICTISDRNILNNSCACP
jgi:Subtilase family/HYR domain